MWVIELRVRWGAAVEHCVYFVQQFLLHGRICGQHVEEPGQQTRRRVPPSDQDVHDDVTQRGVVIVDGITVLNKDG